MKKIIGLPWMHFDFLIRTAEDYAKLSTCSRRKCGAIIHKDNLIIGAGYSSPLKDSEEFRRCDFDKYSLDKKVTDKTCCQHAERRALDDALDRYNKEKLIRGVMIFAQVDENNNSVPAGRPYCTKCSKDALDLGITKWVLKHENGIYIYGAGEYHNMSLNFQNN